MIPELDPEGSLETHLPRGSKDLRGGFILLCAREPNPRPLRECEANALLRFTCIPSDSEFRVCRWAKLRIPTGQTCYTAWKEKEKPLGKRRTARNVKVRSHRYEMSILMIYLWY